MAQGHEQQAGDHVRTNNLMTPDLKAVWLAVYAERFIQLSNEGRSYSDAACGARRLASAAVSELDLSGRRAPHGPYAGT